jgi:hypothetical protein
LSDDFLSDDFSDAFLSLGLSDDLFSDDFLSDDDLSEDVTGFEMLLDDVLVLRSLDVDVDEGAANFAEIKLFSNGFVIVLFFKILARIAFNSASESESESETSGFDFEVGLAGSFFSFLTGLSRLEVDSFLFFFSFSFSLDALESFRGLALAAVFFSPAECDRPTLDFSNLNKLGRACFKIFKSTRSVPTKAFFGTLSFLIRSRRNFFPNKATQETFFGFGDCALELGLESHSRSSSSLYSISMSCGLIGVDGRDFTGLFESTSIGGVSFSSVFDSSRLFAST